MAFNIKKLANKKNAMFFGGGVAGYWVGKEVTDNQWIPTINAKFQGFIEGAAKLVVGAALYSQGKGEAVKGFGVGLGLNGGVQLVDEGMSYFAANKGASTNGVPSQAMIGGAGNNSFTGAYMPETSPELMFMS